jgi:predicted metal-dependent hydrolase
VRVASVQKSEELKNKEKIENAEKFLTYKDKAYSIALERLSYFNSIYGYRWNKITIKNQKTRWGSCSRKGNINFNYKIVLLSLDCIDYIIVHELCHLKEFNHSKDFWSLVEEAIPNHLEIRRELRTKNLSLL